MYILITMNFYCYCLAIRIRTNTKYLKDHTSMRYTHCILNKPTNLHLSVFFLPAHSPSNLLSHLSISALHSSGASSCGQCPIPGSVTSSQLSQCSPKRDPGWKPPSTGVQGSFSPHNPRTGTLILVSASSGEGPAGPRKIFRKTFAAFGSSAGHRMESINASSARSGWRG